MKIPDSPSEAPPKIRRGEELDFEEMVQILDRLRRAVELTEGSPVQEDASLTGRISVPGGTSLTITIEPDDGRKFYLLEAGIQPFNADMVYSHSADGELSTDSNVLPAGNPYPVNQKVELFVDNPTASPYEANYYTNAREVKK